MEIKFCPQCGFKLKAQIIGDEGEVPFCSQCSRPWFGFSYPCIIALVVNEIGKIALLRQSYGDPGRYVFVAGYIKPGERAEDAVCREVREELGLEVERVKYINSYYFEKHDNLMLGFVCRALNSGFTLSCEVETADWFSIQEALNKLKDGSIARSLLLDYLKQENL
ncbi:MAG TPA: NAD(+) diphosphatase [Candidatus Avimonas sp.]|nr:NUDIX domain-containing protein [Clostridiales bacterium]HPU58390.1 NAD(+) diphosphatase [Candidatus Avimonas sp.]